MLQMIRKENLEAMIKAIGYIQSSRAKVFEKKFSQFDCAIEVDFNGNGSINYPEDKGMKITRKTTCNFSQPENFVVLECITRLMDKGYRPEHIELEKEWTLGHSDKGGFADILVKDADGKTLFIVECKTSGNEYKKELNNTLNDGGQLFSYWKQEGLCKWLSLYASDFDGTNVSYTTETIDCSDDANILATAKKDPSILLYRDAGTTEDLFTVWDETYDKRLCGDIIFRDDSQAYQIGIKPLRKVDLKDFSENDKVVNKFEEILRHNNVSDKENAFNRLIALFICKLVDEIQKGDNDIVDFQYKVGTDTYETLQDRLQRLHKEGMEKFMREEIFYVADDYAENLVQQYTGQKRQKMIEDLRNTLRVLKFYTNNDFAFKDVHNEELFYQNGKILVEVVQLFENYRIIGSNDVQMLGDLFEQLLNKGFKQNEGQFFTPIPITRFIWDSLPIERIIKKTDGIEFPKMIDYACGAGHFLTQGFEAVNAGVLAIDPSYDLSSKWAEHKIFGVEKDYRLARVSKISLFMHGAGDGNIIFGDGLENYRDKDIIPESFDILVANPPYSVKAFKPHLKLKDNSFTIIDKISNDGAEIETLFVERITQLVKADGVAAVVLPVSILNKESESFVSAREIILKNFYVRAIAQFGGKTFGATGTNTVILFLEKFSEPPKRLDLVSDSINAIFTSADLSDWEDDEILFGYLNKINVDSETYSIFINRNRTYSDWRSDDYFRIYYEAFTSSSEYSTKIKQKTFAWLSDSDKEEWFNEHFYNYAHQIEFEKLTYFALVYNQTRALKTDPGYTNYRLTDKSFELSIGNRVLSTEVLDEGKYPVISANVYEEFGRIDKLNLSDFSLPSILWGIDGDWMVNIIPPNTPFYPTDHCGVLRIKDSSIVPEYFATALFVEGQFERFSRSNRASTQRIKSLTIQIPQKEKQEAIVLELKSYDNEIARLTSDLIALEETIKKEFISRFGIPVENTNGLPISTLEKICTTITDGAHNSPKEEVRSSIPMLSVKDMTICGFDYKDCKHISSDDYEALKRNGCQPLKDDVLLAKDGSYFKYAFVVSETIEQAILSSIAILRPDTTQVLPVFLQYYLLTDRIFKMVKEEFITGMGLKRVILDDIKRIPVYIPDIKEQEAFCKYVEKTSTKRDELMKKIAMTKTNKQGAIDQYFK